MTAVNVGDALQRKLLVAIAERGRQVEAFREILATIERLVRAEWKQQIEAWLEDPTQKSPYTLQRKGVFMVLARSNPTRC